MVRQFVKQAGVGEQDITLYDASRGISDATMTKIP